jgi:SNF2 family DNA or RNA helicase
MELKKCCNHRFPFKNVEDVTFKFAVETLIRAAGEIILLGKLLLRLRDKGHRVLVFSQMVTMLDILSDYYRMRGSPFQRLDRSMPNDLRVRAVDHYNAPESTDHVFLISTQAGGLGINLDTADTVSYLTQTGIHKTVFRRNLSCASHRTNKGR